MKPTFGKRLTASYLFVVAVTLTFAAAILIHRLHHAFVKDLIWAGLASMLVALIVALITVRRLSLPLQELVTLSGQIGSGQVPETPNVDSRDEFGRLAQAYHEMAKRIEEKVTELTRERTQLGTMLSSLVEGIVALDH